LVDRIVYCANTERSYVFFAQSRGLSDHCSEKKEVPDELRADLHQVFLNRGEGVCETGDPRLAPTKLVETVLADPRLQLTRHGLRLFGGIYCQSLNLYAVKVNHALSFNGSVLLKGAYFSNVTIGGDLSFDKARVPGEITLSHTSVAGTLYGQRMVIESFTVLHSRLSKRATFWESVFYRELEIDWTQIAQDLKLQDTIIKQLVLLNDEVAEDVNLRHATVLTGARIDRSIVRGRIDAADTAWTVLLIRQNPAIGTAAFVANDVRCRVEFTHNHIADDLVLEDTSLGRIVGDIDEKTKQPVSLGTWADKRIDAVENRVNQLLGGIKELSGKEPIHRGLITDTRSWKCGRAQRGGRFVGNQIRRNLYVRSFEFPVPGTLNSEDPASAVPVGGPFVPIRPEHYLELGDTTVGGTTLLSIWPLRREFTPAERDNAAFQIVGLEGLQTDTLIVDLRDIDKPFSFKADHLKFERVAHDKPQCPASAAPREIASLSKSDCESEMTVPEARELVDWLSKNRIRSTQPYVAAIAAYQRAGLSATDLKIKKAEIQWHRDVYAMARHAAAPLRSKAGADDDGVLAWVVLSTWALLGTAFFYIYGDLLGYGHLFYRLLLISVPIAVAGLLFITRYLKVRYAISGIQGRRFTIGWWFVLDRMVPAYHLDEAHYNVRAFYFANGAPIDARTKAVLFRVLRWLKVVGLLATLVLGYTLKESLLG
jgi:hypothetical protein